LRWIIAGRGGTPQGLPRPFITIAFWERQKAASGPRGHRKR